jgi:hypothetical protein
MATEDTVNTIAKALGEVDEQPMTQITGVVKALGDEASLSLLEETKRIEASGGMMLPDNSRKRTPGGVFFFLARQKLSHEDKVNIFRPVKPAKPAQPVVEAARLPRRRVIDVAPPKEIPVRPRGGFIPPGLPLAAKRVRARETIQNAVAALPPDDQVNLLLEVVAELYERRGVRIPEPSPAPAPVRTAPISEPPPPPPSQRPIPVPIPAQAAVPAPEPVREEPPPSSEPARRPAATRTRAAATRTPAKKRA